MTNFRNIITVDGKQVAIINRYGIILKHQIQQWKHKFSKEFNIGYNGVRCIHAEPIRGLKLWRPEQN